MDVVKELPDMYEKALGILRKALGNPHAEFHPGQWESIAGLLQRKRLLVVQRTGWGKSVVYFMATRLLRDLGKGPTLLISPLLSLMRNQMQAASSLGINAQSINSTNTDQWDAITRDLLANRIDLLLISPERLANQDFRMKVLGPIASHIGLFVVDEAHCISDWGHDFRPDYRRIVRILDAMPENIPVLATTATANDRVVSDIQAQLGERVQLIRGPLTRESLQLQNIRMPSASDRLAWLADVIPNLEGNGIVYVLTQRDANRVAEWLGICGIHAAAYHADIKGDEDEPLREDLESKLLNNELKVLVATVALGMGFDKPDLGFVIHFQRPSSVVHYYQQVGRAGRAIAKARGVLFHGEEDDRIARYFIDNAFPPQKHIHAVLEALDAHPEGLSIPALQQHLNISQSKIEKTLKYLTVESPAPVTKDGSRWRVTLTAIGYQIDQAHIDQITELRLREQKQMQEYMDHPACLMQFLSRALDDPHARPCGKCGICLPEQKLPVQVDADLANRAALFLRRSFQEIPPRLQWPAGNPMSPHGFAASKLSEEYRAETGRALSLWRDAGWGKAVAEGKYTHGHFPDSLVAGCLELMAAWNPEPAPVWLTCIPSHRHPGLVPDFALRLANALGIPFLPVLKKVSDNPEQKHMENSYQQVRNLAGVFMVEPCPSTPCLLVDDMVDSRWTFTVAAAQLRKAGVSRVFPLALALNSPRMD